MAGQTEQRELLTDVILEDKIADIWPDYQCLYDVTSPDFKNRDLRQKSYEEMAEKVGKSGKTSFKQPKPVLKPLLRYILFQVN